MTKKLQGTVLIVDDEENIRMLLRMFCENLGLKVVEANDGREALKLFESNKIHAVISDLKMPNMGGLELLENLRNRDFNGPCIVVTAFATAETYQQAERFGVFKLVTKPFNFDEVSKIIRAAIESYLGSSDLASNLPLDSSSPEN